MLLDPGIFISCSSDKATDPIEESPPEIIWTSRGLDSIMIYSILANSGYILAGTNEGLFKSSGESWNYINLDSTNSMVTDFYMHADGSILAGTSNNGIYKSSDTGNSWEHIGLQNIGITSLTADTQGKIFAGTRNGIYASIVPYDEWWPVNSDFNNQIFSSLLVTSQNTVFAGGTGVYRSDDNGRTWNLKNNGLGNWPVYSLISGKDGEIYAGADIGGFFLTTDNGESWTRSNTGMSNTEILSLAMNKDGHIFSGIWRGGVYRSTNGGNDWMPVDSGLTNKSVGTITISPDDYLFAGTFRGIFMTEDKCTISSLKGRR